MFDRVGPLAAIVALLLLANLYVSSSKSSRRVDDKPLQLTQDAIGTLKNEVEMLRSQMKSQIDAMAATLKATPAPTPAPWVSFETNGEPRFARNDAERKLEQRFPKSLTVAHNANGAGCCARARFGKRASQLGGNHTLPV